jgi:hypothetical protein
MWSGILAAGRSHHPLSRNATLADSYSIIASNPLSAAGQLIGLAVINGAMKRILSTINLKAPVHDNLSTCIISIE